jgi:hypothetical protein
MAGKGDSLEIIKAEVLQRIFKEAHGRWMRAMPRNAGQKSSFQ